MDSNTTKTIHEQAMALLEGTMSDEGWAEVLACNGQCDSGPCIEMNARLRKIAAELERTLTDLQLHTLELLRGGGAPPVLTRRQRQAASYCKTLGLTAYAPRDVARGCKPPRFVLTDRGRALLRTAAISEPKPKGSS